MSTTVWNDQELEAVLGEAVRQSMTNPEYRNLLLTDTSNALEQIAGRALPNSLKVVFADTDTRIVSASLPKPVIRQGLIAEGLERAAGSGPDYPCDPNYTTCRDYTCYVVSCFPRISR